MKKTTPVSFRNVDINSGFWAKKQELNRKVTVYSVQDRFEDTGRFEAFKFNWKDGSDIPRPHFFWDSDVAKWLESVFYIAAKSEDGAPVKKAEEIIDLIEKNQSEDGYFNIFHTVVEPGTRFTNRDHHELYCLGHLIEAAVSHYETTGSDRFIKIVDKYVDLVIKSFVTDKTALFVTPGHEEIELALVKLYNVRKDKKYLDLAKFFVDERGKNAEDVLDWCNSKYFQSDVPVRQQKEAEGHSVRACYLYSGMADVARCTDDEELLETCRALFDDITRKKMYISGGIGSSHQGEAFTVAYDLPNDTAYAETCASIALSFFANRMKDIDFDSKYADIVELEMYNGGISGLSLDGKAFFYENPLEINLADRTRHISVSKSDRLPITERKEVFSCSCCPPNLTRYISSIGDTLLSVGDNALFIHQFMSANAEAGGAAVEMKTDYPYDGTVDITVTGACGKDLFIRLPGWCEKYTVDKEHTVENGYIRVAVDSDEFSLKTVFDVSPRFVFASSHVRADACKAAVMAGPVLYCAERCENDFELFSVKLDTDVKPTAQFSEYFNANILTAQGFTADNAGAPLYSDKKPEYTERTDIKLIPYFGFANRGESDMAVWLFYK